MTYRILVADDSRMIRRLIRQALVGAGFEVVGEAEDGHQAVQLFERLLPDLVTMDVTMPELDGLTAFHQIRQRDPQARILLVTSLDQKAVAQEVAGDPFGGILAKPFQSEDLIRHVSRMLA